MPVEHLRTSELLDRLATQAQAAPLTLHDVLEQFSRRAFGLLLLLVTLPAFLPLPAGAGAISGPLVALLGIQLLFGMRRPWLPKRLAMHEIAATRLQALALRLGPWLRRLERLSRPRWEILILSLPGSMLCGLLIVLLGVLLSLPVPLTNYPLALLIIGFAVALIERDGVLLLFLWLLSLITIAAMAGLTGEAFNWVQNQWIHWSR